MSYRRVYMNTDKKIEDFYKKIGKIVAKYRKEAGFIFENGL